VLATLLERDDGEALPLPSTLADRYGGPLRLPRRTPYVFANFVSTIDGVVSFDAPGIARASEVSHGHAGDRFVLALLRAAADAVVVGAGTLRKEPDGVWTPEFVFREAGDAFAELRRALGATPRPLLVLVSASGALDLSLPAFDGGGPVVIATTDEGARALADAPRHVRVHAIARAGARIGAGAIVDLARRESGGERILTEGGPRLLAPFFAEGALDELFLTIAPGIAGRTDDERRLALVEGVAFRPDRAPRGRLLSVKAADDYLFTRFAFDRSA
jgi:riboflavin biosynthesis pyrimidine reductase